MGPFHCCGIHSEQAEFIDTCCRIRYSILASVSHIEAEIPRRDRLFKLVICNIFRVVLVLGNCRPVRRVSEIGRIGKLFLRGVRIRKDLKGEVGGDIQFMLHSRMHGLPGVDRLLRAQVKGCPVIVTGIVARAPLGAVLALIKEVLRSAAHSRISGSAQHFRTIGLVHRDRGIHIDTVRNRHFHCVEYCIVISGNRFHCNCR